MEKILPTILATLTQAPRYKPKFEWSSLWVCNIFRIYESIFWRRVGIKREQVVSQGKVYSFTLENFLAQIEVAIRSYFKYQIPFAVTMVPQAAMLDFKLAFGTAPIMLAISYDTGQTKTATTTSWSHTVTGSNPFLLVGTDQSQNASAITYNSASMSKQVEVVGTASWETFGIWTKGNPSTGSNTVSITTTGGGYYTGSISYSGCQSSNTADATGTASQNASSPLNLSITSIADNCWIVGWFQNADVAISAGSGTTGHTTGADGSSFWGDTNAAIHPAGSTTIQGTYSGSHRCIAAGITIAPFVSATANPAFLIRFALPF